MKTTASFSPVNAGLVLVFGLNKFDLRRYGKVEFESEGGLSEKLEIK
jgi:hypothetical protein